MEARSDLSNVLPDRLKAAEREHVVRTIHRPLQRRWDHATPAKASLCVSDDERTDCG